MTRNPSLELSEVSARFSETEGMLQDARERLQAILEQERRNQEAADNLSESARAVAEFTQRADRVLEEASSAVSAAREILETGRHLIGGNAIGEVDGRVSAVLEEVRQLQSTDAETLAAVNAGAKAREREQQDNKQSLSELQARVSRIDERVAGALEQIQTLATAEAETLAAVNVGSKAREREQQDIKESLSELQARVSRIDERVAGALEQIQKLATTEAETLAAVNAGSKARQHEQQDNKQALAELQTRAADVAGALKSSRKAQLVALGALLVGQVAVALIAILT